MEDYGRSQGGIVRLDEVALTNMKLTIKEQIRGLEIILLDQGDKGETISRSYVAEKLQRIREGSMIFHPLILQTLKEERINNNKKKQ